MSALKPGTRCVIIAGCPNNIGLIVEFIEDFGPFEPSPHVLKIFSLGSPHEPLGI